MDELAAEQHIVVVDLQDGVDETDVD